MTSSSTDTPSASSTLAAAQAMALPSGMRLSEYEVRSVLGCGGFGIVYLAWDHGLQREVAIKEYMPAMLAGRGPDHHVSVRSQATASTFALGLKSFVNEARLLAQFNHPSLVKVHRFWEANDTAYMVMPRYRGRTLRQVRAGMSEPPGDVACRHVLRALMSALDVLHRDDVFHRDIAPDNVLLCEDGTPVLLDFGAARKVIGEGQQALTSILKPHYAPLEQYADQRSMRQGPWTDLYALGATLYYFATGDEPVAAASRALHDDQPRLSDQALSDLSPLLMSVVDWMLELKPMHRPQSVQAVREVVDGHADVPASPYGTRLPTPQATPPHATAVRLRTDIDPTEPPVQPSDTLVLTGNPIQAPRVPTSSPVSSAAAHDAALGPTIVNIAEPVPTPTAIGPAPRRNGAILLILLAVNVMAWWWFTRSATPAGAVAVPTAASAAVAAVAAAPTDAAPISPPAATEPVAVVQPKLPEETIVSVMPARSTSSAAASAPAPLPAKPVKSEGVAVLVPPSADNSADLGAPSRSRSTPAPERASVSTPSTPSTQPQATGPRERCGDRMFIALSMCIKRECDNDATLRSHPECVRMREIEEARRNPGN
jgi:serine/threonine protein kinase